MVNSRRFIVLDRASIQQVLSEREFQMSGMVTDEDITEAGRYLGADLVVVPRVQRIGEFFFVSLKMIEIKTGIIVAQASRDDSGDEISAIRLAEQATDLLLGLPLAGESAKDSLGKPETVAKAPPPAAPAPEKPLAAPDPVAALVVEAPSVTPSAGQTNPKDPNRIGFRLYAMSGSSVADEENLQAGLRATFPLLGIWTLHPQIGSQHSGIATGVSIPMAKIFMPYAAFGLGYSQVEYWYPDNYFEYDEAFTTYFVAGADLRLGPVLINLELDGGFGFDDENDGFLIFTAALGWRF